MSPLDAVFASLADPTRRAIVARLSEGELPLSRLAEPFDMSQTGVSKHVGVLNEAGLVRIEKKGRTRFCSLEPAPMKDAVEWLTRYQEFWLKSLDALEQHLEAKNEEED